MSCKKYLEKNVGNISLKNVKNKIWTNEQFWVYLNFFINIQVDFKTDQIHGNSYLEKC